MGKKALSVRVWGQKLLPPKARQSRLFIKACRAALSHAKGGKTAQGEINIVFVGRARMRALNKKFLDHSHDTDVIAFNYHDSSFRRKPSQTSRVCWFGTSRTNESRMFGAESSRLGPGLQIAGATNHAFGDVFISAFQIPRQARAMGHSSLKEALTLIIHGSLHLVGYDDGDPKAKAAMFRRQNALLKSLGF